MTTIGGFLVALSLAAAASTAPAPDTNAPAPAAPATTAPTTAASAPGGCPEELFRITRSLNANVVVYEVHRRPDSTVDPEEPVRASWILLARHGEREDLNFIERMLAYGFEVRSAAPQRGWWITLKAKKDRPLRVVEREGCLRAIGTIAGREGALRRLYVKADDKRLIPTVEYVELFGEGAGGAPLYEKILNDSAPELDRPEWKGG